MNVSAPILYGAMIGFATLTIAGAAFALIWRFRSRRTAPAPLDHETILLLARAFDQAWDRHMDEMPMELDARSRQIELAKHIVAMARAGEQDENRLSMRGYMKLRATHSVKISSNATEPSADDASESGHMP